MSGSIPRVVVFALALCAPAIPALADSVLGEWELVHQTYGDGGANLVAEGDAPVVLEFFRHGAVIEGRLRSGRTAPMSWPRLLPDETRAIEERERWFAAGEDRARIKYRVAPAPGDDLVLEVTEEYRTTGQELVGVVEVRFLRDGKDHGSYRLNRRFERKR